MKPNGSSVRCRKYLLVALKNLLVMDLRFCQMENVEQHIWKVAFHNIIEALRKSMADDPDFKDQYRSLLLNVIDEVRALSFYLVFLPTSICCLFSWQDGTFFMFVCF